MRRLVIPLALLTVLLLFAGSGVCLVAPGEVVVVRRLGRLLDSPWEPGLHWRFPLGIDRLDRVRALEVRQLTIGLTGPASADFEPSAGEFMTGDLNLLRVQANVQYRAASPADYVLRAEHLEPLLASLAEAALTRTLSASSVDGILRSERQAVAVAVEREIRLMAATHHLGVAILGVNLTDARPPGEVEPDFAAAQSAESQRDRRVNEARSYAETTDTTARSQAQAILEAAHSAALRRKLTASARAERFLVLLAEARHARSLTMRQDLHRIASVHAQPGQRKNRFAAGRVGQPHRTGKPERTGPHSSKVTLRSPSPSLAGETVSGQNWGQMHRGTRNGTAGNPQCLKRPSVVPTSRPWPTCVSGLGGFHSWNRLPGRESPKEPIPDLAPDLAVEVLSEGNTKAEMTRKVREYFDAGVILVWLIDPRKRTARVFSSIENSALVRADQSLDGGAVLPGFVVTLSDLLDRGRRPRKG